MCVWNRSGKGVAVVLISVVRPYSAGGDDDGVVDPFPGNFFCRFLNPFFLALSYTVAVPGKYEEKKRKIMKTNETRNVVMKNRYLYLAVIKIVTAKAKNIT